MRALLAILGLGALALAIAAYVEPPQPSVLIDAAAGVQPIVVDQNSDLDLDKGGNE